MDFFSVVCCAVLLLYQVLRPAVAQGGTVVDRPPSFARRRSPVAAAVGKPLAALVARPPSFDRSPPLAVITYS